VRTVLGQALAVFQAFSLAKPRILRLLSQKLKFWESLFYQIFKNKYGATPRQLRRQNSKKSD
jgi:AraC-like DNA-binding protein